MNRMQRWQERQIITHILDHVHTFTHSNIPRHTQIHNKTKMHRILQACIEREKTYGPLEIGFL